MSEKCLDSERVAVREFWEKWNLFPNQLICHRANRLSGNYDKLSMLLFNHFYLWQCDKKSQEKVSISDCFTFVCVLLGPVNNGRWCCELRAGGRWKFGCLTVWRCGSRWVVSAPPCLLLWTPPVVTHPAANLARPATHQKTGIAGEKCGRKYLKMELWIGWKGGRMSQN